MMGTPTIYQIRIKEHLAELWVEWFDPLVIQYEANGETILIGPLRDQAELFGMLTKVNNLNLTLIAVEKIGKSEAAKDHPS